MSTNDLNTTEDAEMAEYDGEKVVTMMDVLQEQEDFEEDANAVLGASDDKNCTYSKGYIKRQAIYACMTCCADVKDDPSKQAGLCLACSLSCHENHELIELYTKRNFRCDCGNSKFNLHPCQFTPNKSEVNEENIYNQNFSGLYCICHRPYPDPDIAIEQEMIQCIICEDWLHSSHLDAAVPPNDQYTEMICKGCMDQNEFLHDYGDLAVNKENVEIDILNNTSLGNVSKCNGISDTETAADENLEIPNRDSLNESGNEKPDIDSTTIGENITDVSSGLKQCDAESPSVNEQVHDKSSVDQTQDQNESQHTRDTSKSDIASLVTQNSKDYKDSSPPNIPEAKQSVDDNANDKELKANVKSEEITSSIEYTSEKIVSDSEAEYKNNDENEKSKVAIVSACEQEASEMEQKNIEHIEQSISSTEIISDETNEQIEDDISSAKVDQKTEETSSSEIISDISKTEEKKDNEQEVKSSTDSMCDNIISETEEIISKESEETISSTDTNKLTSNEMNNEHGSLNEENITSAGKVEIADNRSQEQVEEDLLLADPKETVPSKSEDVGHAALYTDCINTTEIINDDKSPETELQKMDTSGSADMTTEIKVGKAFQGGSKPLTMIAENVHNENQKDNIKNNLNSDNELTKPTAIETDILKRKHVSEADNEVKRPKMEKTQCVRPKGVKKVCRGATFWPSNFRHTLCTCSECITMYKDLSVLFLIDPEDTVTAYERLGKEKTNGKPVTQYEKGMAALSSLGRVQQINALTEYAKMRDKLLEFLKSFKDRKVIVKEEDIKAFFAGMKPVREPDGVYFCR